MEKKRASEILDVDIDSTDEEIKNRYRELAGTMHPDQDGTSGLFKQIKKARNTLLSESTVNDYSDQNNQGEQSTSARQSREQNRENSASTGQKQVDINHTHNPSFVDNTTVKRVEQKAISGLVTENRLTKRSPGFSHPTTLTDMPLIGYIAKNELPHFALRFTKATIYNETVSPQNGGFLVLSDVRILIIMGTRGGDETLTVPYDQVTAVDSRKMGLGVHHELIIGTREAEMHFKIDHNPVNESGVSGNRELDDEIDAAAEFIQKAVDSIQE